MGECAGAYCNTLQHAATMHCNCTLQLHTATAHCNCALQHTATQKTYYMTNVRVHRYILNERFVSLLRELEGGRVTVEALRYARHCNALRRTATHCNALQHTATHCSTLLHTAIHCTTLHHTATSHRTRVLSVCCG